MRMVFVYSFVATRRNILDRIRLQKEAGKESMRGKKDEGTATAISMKIIVAVCDSVDA